MTKEELEKLKSTVKQWLFHTGSLDPTNYANELKLKFIEPREKRIANLEAQIEKMKCCENCQHWEGREPIPSLAEEGYYCFNDYPFECKRWELAEELKEIKEK